MPTIEPGPGLEPSAQTALDAVGELRAARLGPRHVLLIVAILLANVFDGYDTLNPSYVISFVAKPWHLSHSASGFMVSAGLIGFMVGALAHGPIADRVGRRPVLLVSLAGAGLFSALTAVMGTGYGSFVILRLITGLFLGVIMPLGTAYLREFTPARSETKVVTGGVCGYCLGGVLSAAVGIYATPSLGWTSLYWFGGLSLILAIALIPVLPESVHYLVLAGRHAAVARVLTLLRPDRAAAYRDASFARPRALPSARESVGEIISPAYRRTSVALWACAFLVLFCIYGLSGWLPSAMEARGNSFAASFASVAILQFAGVAGCFSVAQASDRSKSPSVITRGVTILMGLATLAVIGVAIGTGPVGDLILIAVAGFGIVGGQNVVVVLSADAYPAYARSTGAGTMFGVGRIGAILGPYLIGWLLDWSHGSPESVFTAIAVATLLAAVGGVVLTAARRAQER